MSNTDSHIKLRDALQAADEAWKDFFGTKERLAYIRAHRDQFAWLGFRDLLRCVRGEYFAHPRRDEILEG